MGKKNEVCDNEPPQDAHAHLHDVGRDIGHLATRAVHKHLTAQLVVLAGEWHATGQCVEEGCLTWHDPPDEWKGRESDGGPLLTAMAPTIPGYEDGHGDNINVSEGRRL